MRAKTWSALPRKQRAGIAAFLWFEASAMKRAGNEEEAHVFHLAAERLLEPTKRKKR